MKRRFLWASNIALILTTAVPLRAADDAKVNTLAKCEHEINGVKYFEYVLGSEDFKSRGARSKFSKMPLFARSNAGDIALQGDHGQVSFRNIKIRRIEPAK